MSILIILIFISFNTLVVKAKKLVKKILSIPLLFTTNFNQYRPFMEEFDSSEILPSIQILSHPNDFEVGTYDYVLISLISWFREKPKVKCHFSTTCLAVMEPQDFNFREILAVTDPQTVVEDLKLFLDSFRFTYYF